MVGKETSMPIPFSIVETQLSGKPSYVGRVSLRGTLDREALVRRMADRASGQSPHQIRATLGLLAEVVEAVCLDGYRVNLEGFLLVTPVLGGPFDSLTDTFHRGRNSLLLKAQVSTAVNKRAFRMAKVRKVDPVDRRPVLNQVVDTLSSDKSEALKPGSIVSVSGYRLKFDPGRLEEGLRLVNLTNRQQVIPVTRLHKVGHMELVFLMPSAPFSEGYFEVSSFLQTKTLRTGRSEGVRIESAGASPQNSL